MWTELLVGWLAIVPSRVLSVRRLLVVKNCIMGYVGNSCFWPMPRLAFSVWMRKPGVVLTCWACILGWLSREMVQGSRPLLVG